MAQTNEPKQPRIAVVIPCFEDGDYVSEAVGSVNEPERIETVVVDDGSTDSATKAALERIERQGTLVVRLAANGGVSAARNAGVQATTSPYVYPLDADDLAPAGVLAEMADRLDAEPDAQVCYGDFLEFGDQLRLRSVPASIDGYRLAYTNEYPSAALFQRSALEAAGGWRRVSEELDARSDWGLWMALAEAGGRGIHMGPGVLTRIRRLHGDRLDAEGRSRRPLIYAGLRKAHPALFTDLKARRRASSLGPIAKLLYPVLYGRGGRRSTLEVRVKALLDRRGVWRQRAVDPDERRRLERLVAQARGGARSVGAPGGADPGPQGPGEAGSSH